MKNILAWLNCHDGATAVEYALIAGGLACAIVAAVFLMGDNLETVFNTMGDRMSSISTTAS